jgi:hypothetical protein
MEARMRRNGRPPEKRMRLEEALKPLGGLYEFLLLNQSHPLNRVAAQLEAITGVKVSGTYLRYLMRRARSDD